MKTSALLIYLRKAIFPDSVYNKFGVLIAGISLVALLNHSIQFGLSDTIAVVIKWYERLLDLTIGWLAIPLNTLLVWISSLFSWNLQLEQHWQHVFVLMNIYFVRDATFYLSKAHRMTDRCIWQFFLGLFIALVCSSLSGVFEDNGSSFQNSLTIALIPVLGILLYDLIERYWYVKYFASKEAFSNHGLSNSAAQKFYRKRIFERAIGLIAFAILFICSWRYVIGPNTNGAGVSSLVLSVLLIALYWISGRASIHYEHYGKHKNGITIAEKVLLHSGTSELGGLMLGTFIWLVILLLCNAGLGLAGL